LIFDFLTLKEKKIFNKTRQGVGIIRMEEALAPREYGMEVTGHRDPISYGKLIFVNFFLFLFLLFHNLIIFNF
jgi:hypothetical protein